MSRSTSAATATTTSIWCPRTDVASSASPSERLRSVQTYARGVTDRKPPRVEADELATLQALLQYQRESLVRKIEGLTPAQASWSPGPTGTNLLWLVTHMADAEQTWMVRRFAGLATDVGEEPPEEDV